MLSKADRIRNARVPVTTGEHGRRLPPGQVLTEKFPILHEGDVPEYELATWALSVFGETVGERVFTFQNILDLPQSRSVSDIHCVTRWSKFDTEWDGVRFLDLFQTLAVGPEIRYVMAYGDYDYSAILPLEDCLRPDVMLAHSFRGQPLTPKHGWPLRLVVPHLYFWKSVKWLRGIELLQDYRDGYWEARGFHDYGDPFREQRFSGDPLPIPEDEWLNKDFD